MLLLVFLTLLGLNLHHLVIASVKEDCGTLPGELNGFNLVPWQASFQWKSSKRHFCSGALISSKWIVTSASCFRSSYRPPVTESQIEVLLGAYNLTNPNKTIQTNQPVMAIKRIVVHNNFVPGHNDIALVKLAKEVNINRTSNLRAICVGSQTSESPLFVIATGWNHTSSGSNRNSILLKQRVKLLPVNQCKENYPFSTTKHQCGEWQMDCVEDVGTPLQHLKKSRWYLQAIGLASSQSCALKPAIFTRVSSYYRFIRKYVNN